MKNITQSEWDKTPKDYKTIKADGTHQKLFMVEGQGTTLEPVNVLHDKKMMYKFGKEAYLLGTDNEGTKYFLESARWDCGWYWGFGYIESYSNNNAPECSRDIASHEHATDFYSDWFGGDNSRLVKTTFTESEGWELAELLKQFYTLGASAQMFERGGCHISTSKATEKTIQSKYLAKKINEKILPVVFERIYKILGTAKEN